MQTQYVTDNFRHLRRGAVGFDYVAVDIQKTKRLGRFVAADVGEYDDADTAAGFGLA